MATEVKKRQTWLSILTIEFLFVLLLLFARKLVRGVAFAEPIQIA